MWKNKKILSLAFFAKFLPSGPKRQSNVPLWKMELVGRKGYEISSIVNHRHGLFLTHVYSEPRPILGPEAHSGSDVTYVKFLNIIIFLPDYGNAVIRFIWHSKFYFGPESLGLMLYVPIRITNFILYHRNVFKVSYKLSGRVNHLGPSYSGVKWIQWGMIDQNRTPV